MKSESLSGFEDYKVLDTDKEWVLYHNCFSLCSRKVRVCLKELDIAAELKHIDIIETNDCENLEKKFLKINPKATVPVLLHHGNPIYESHEQIAFLEKYNPILSKSEIVDFWVKRGSLVGEPNENQDQFAGNCVSIFTVPLFVSMLKNISIFKFIKYFIKHPVRFRAFNFLMFKVLSYGVFKKGTPLFKITKSAVKNLNIHFDDLNDHLNEKKWIDGDKFSLADITWMVLFHRLEESQLTNYFLNNRGNLIGYFNRLKARESYKSELLDYEENSIKVGKDKLIIAIESNQTLNKYYSFIKIL